MVVISKAKLISFYNADSQAKEPLLKWYNLTLLSDWEDFHSIKETFNTMIHFSKRTLYIRFVGTHQQNDKINCKTV